MQNRNIFDNSNLRQSILELRTRLSGEEITEKGYHKDIEKLLADIGDDIKKHFTELERSIDSGELCRTEYELRLMEIFPDGSNGQQIPARPDDAYDVFLSYSHKDRDEFGMEYILRIKDNIEEALAGLVDSPKVYEESTSMQGLCLSGFGALS